MSLFWLALLQVHHQILILLAILYVTALHQHFLQICHHVRHYPESHFLYKHIIIYCILHHCSVDALRQVHNHTLCHFPSWNLLYMCIFILHTMPLPFINLFLQVHHCTVLLCSGSHFLDKYITILHFTPLLWVALLQANHYIILTALCHTCMSLGTIGWLPTEFQRFVQFSKSR